MGFETTHGMTNHPLYAVWENIKQCCYNPNAKRYRFYGGKGIKVCDRWRDSFENFYSDVMAELGPRPEGHIFHRTDTSGDYAPGNVEWANWHRVNHNGKSLSPEAVAKRTAKLAGKPRTLSPEHIAAIRASAPKGAAARRGRKRSPEAIAKTAAWHRGKKRSPEACAAVRAGIRAARLAKAAQQI